jgi:hypothetical protein
MKLVKPVAVAMSKPGMFLTLSWPISDSLMAQQTANMERFIVPRIGTTIPRDCTFSCPAG